MDQSYSSRLANITLPDCDGNPVRLGSLWSEHPVVLVFLRHYGWIFCREHVAQLREHEQAFRSKGANLAAVGLGDAQYAKAFREQTGIKFPLLIDERRQAYGALELKKASLLHLFRKDNMVARKRAKSGGHRQRRLGKDPLQLGGSFVFGPGGKEYFVHISETFGDNAQPAALLTALPWKFRS